VRGARPASMGWRLVAALDHPGMPALPKAAGLSSPFQRRYSKAAPASVITEGNGRRETNPQQGFIAYIIEETKELPGGDPPDTNVTSAI
jgi:hypothetical protein